MAASARDLDLRQHHGVETPEHVDVQFELAGVGSRMAAGLLDVLFLVLSLLVVVIGGGRSATRWLRQRGPELAERGDDSPLVLFRLGLLHAIRGAERRPHAGKQALGIRVVMDTGRSITPQAAVVRNLVRFIDCYAPIPVAPALLSMFLHPSNKRPGDMAAGTIVVRDHPTDWSLGATLPVAEETVAEPLEAGPPELAEEEFRLLDRFLARINDLTPEVRCGSPWISCAASSRASRAAPGDLQAYLVAVFADEQRKRRSRLPRAPRPGPPAAIHHPAERFVQKKRNAWEAFRTTALRMERSGIGALAPGKSPRSRPNYREVGGRSGACPHVSSRSTSHHLPRASSLTAGHNALYRARGKDRTPLRTTSCAIFRRRRPVVAVCAPRLPPVLSPRGIGYVMIREAARARRGADAGNGRACRGGSGEPRGGPGLRRDQQGKSARDGGIHHPEQHRHFIRGFRRWRQRVGLLTAWLLYTNGLMLGLALGLFQNYDAARYLLTFILGHGIPGLTAIFISAGGRVSSREGDDRPGDRTRKDALVLEDESRRE